MPRHEDNTNPQPTIPRLSSTSYVYPVRSLLEGRIQPASPPATSRSSDDVAGLFRAEQAQNSQENTGSSFESLHRPSADEQNPTKVHTRRRSSSIPDFIGQSVTASSSSNTSDVRQAAPRAKSTRKKTSTLDRFSAGDNPYFPRTFSSISPSTSSGQTEDMDALDSAQASMFTDQVLGNQIHDIFSRGPNSSAFRSTSRHIHGVTSPTISNTAPPQPPPILNPGDPPLDNNMPQEEHDTRDNAYSFPMDSSSLVTPIAMYPTHSNLAGNQGVHMDESEHALRLPFNPSEYGIVHLPPVPSSRNSSTTGSSSVSSRSRSSKSRTGHDTNNLIINALTGASSRSSPPGVVGSGPSSERAAASPGNASSSAPSSGKSQQFYSGSNGTGSSHTSDEPYVTFRFRSHTDANGFHVVTGRDGKLEHCEDEPIRTPGAVQGYGVLIAVEELDDNLRVSQVSENSSELLGLSPHYLFGLECFTDILPDNDAGILWDNIEALTDSKINSEEEHSPHVFLLSGYGAPQSALPHERDTVDGKRCWTCWCAIHRSQVRKDGRDVAGPIIMEFELERDTLNPLYPPVLSQKSSNMGSPSNMPNEFISSRVVMTGDRNQSQSPVSTESSGQSTVGNRSLGSLDTPSPMSSSSVDLSTNPTTNPPYGLQGDNEWRPSAEDILESTTCHSRPLPALERLRNMTRPYGSTDAAEPQRRQSRRSRGRSIRGSSTVGMMDMFAVMAQINEQLGAAPDLETYLNVVVGVIKDLTQFHRVMVYQFDEVWNGKVVAELVDWSQTTDLFRGLYFPASDIPAQARQLYEINKVRLLYDTALPTARIVVRSKQDLETPLNMTHCYLRAMSPIHIKYLENMGVRASMSISIMGSGRLWGLVNCHTYGTRGMRVSFPVRQMLRLLSQSISKNIERLSFVKRLHTRKLINAMTSDQQSTGYIVSNADDLLGLFDADFGILVIGEGAKILGPNQHGQEILIMAEYLRLKQFNTIQASQAVVRDFADLDLTAGLEIIAGLLYVPLSSGGQDFIAFLRKGQLRTVRWAGRPHKSEQENKLEPRASFKIWSETVAGRSRAWTDEQLETAAVVSLVYGKFIEVWREKENTIQTTKLTNLLLANASHEVRTPLNHIINYLEMAMNGPIDKETRDNLKKSHAASKSLLFTINDLLDLTRLETGNETSFNEPFDLHYAIEEATHLYRKEAGRRNIQFNVDLVGSPSKVIGDTKKIRTVVQNLTANALKYTTTGSITVSCTTFGEPEGLRKVNQTAVEIVVADTGCGIAPEKLASIFREFEQVESSEPKTNTEPGVGLGLAVVARIVEQLGGQLRVDSTAGEGSRFSFLIPLSLATESDVMSRQGTSSLSSGSSRAAFEVLGGSRSSSSHSNASAAAGITSMVRAMSSTRLNRSKESLVLKASEEARLNDDSTSFVNVSGTQVPVVVHPVNDVGPSAMAKPVRPSAVPVPVQRVRVLSSTSRASADYSGQTKLRVLVVEDNDINRTILAKRLTRDGHTVVTTTNGQEGLDRAVADSAFDVVLMDLQMPILNGFDATRKIREFEQTAGRTVAQQRPSHALSGRLPVFAVSASLVESQRDELIAHGMDGWILKPIDFKRLGVLLRGVVDATQRAADVHRPGCNWERGGWLQDGTSAK